MLRDIALQSGGLLVQKIGGPSVKPYQPPNIWEQVSYPDQRHACVTRKSMATRSIAAACTPTVKRMALSAEHGRIRCSGARRGLHPAAAHRHATAGSGDHE